MLKDTESQKDIQMKWLNISIRNNLLEPIVGVSKNIKAKKNAAIETLEGKQPHEIFEYFVNQEMKEMILEETNQYVSQNNITLFQLTMSNLNTFNAILMLCDYHSLPRTQMFWEKEDVGVPIVYEALSLKQSKSICILLIISTCISTITFQRFPIFMK